MKEPLDGGRPPSASRPPSCRRHGLQRQQHHHNTHLLLTDCSIRFNPELVLPRHVVGEKVAGGVKEKGSRQE